MDHSLHLKAREESTVVQEPPRLVASQYVAITSPGLPGSVGTGDALATVARRREAMIDLNCIVGKIEVLAWWLG